MLWKHLAAGLLTVLILATSGLGEEKPPQIISGKLIDAETEEPIEGVRVWIPGTTIETKSDILGEFVIRGVPDTKFVIRIEDTAFFKVTVDRLLPLMQSSTIELRLHRMSLIDKLLNSPPGISSSMVHAAKRVLGDTRSAIEYLVDSIRAAD